MDGGLIRVRNWVFTSAGQLVEQLTAARTSLCRWLIGNRRVPDALDLPIGCHSNQPPIVQ